MTARVTCFHHGRLRPASSETSSATACGTWWPRRSANRRGRSCSMRCTTRRACRTDPAAAELAEYGLDVPADGRITASRPDEQTMSPVGFLEFAAPRIAAAIGDACDNRKPGGVSSSWKRRRVAQPPGAYRDGRSGSSAAWTGPTSATLKATKTIRSDCSIPMTPAAS